MAEINDKQLGLVLFKLLQETNSLTRAVAMQLARMHSDLNGLKSIVVATFKANGFDYPSDLSNDIGFKVFDATLNSIQAQASASEEYFRASLKAFVENPPEDLFSNKNDYEIDFLSISRDAYKSNPPN